MRGVVNRPHRRLRLAVLTEAGTDGERHGPQREHEVGDGVGPRNTAHPTASDPNRRRTAGCERRAGATGCGLRNRKGARAARGRRFCRSDGSVTPSTLRGRKRPGLQPLLPRADLRLPDASPHVRVSPYKTFWPLRPLRPCGFFLSALGLRLPDWGRTPPTPTPGFASRHGRSSPPAAPAEPPATGRPARAGAGPSKRWKTRASCPAVRGKPRCGCIPRRQRQGSSTRASRRAQRALCTCPAMRP